MNRGVVMEVGKKEAVVMTADGRFVKVPLQQNVQVGEEIRFQSAVTERSKPKKLIWYAGAVAAILLFILPVFMLVQSTDHTVVAYVSMDVNPSIEIGIDQDKLVRELHALNKDGEAIVAAVDFEGKSLEKVVAALTKKLAESHYLDEADKDIVITSLLLSEQIPSEFEAVLSDQMDQAIQMTLTQLTTKLTANVTTLSVPVELREAASANGISSGKMAVYLMAKDEGYDIELDNLREHSIDKVTQPIGGVQTIVENSENSSKEKLKELVQKEKNEKKNSDSKATAKPAAGSTAKPTEATESPVKKPQPTPGNGNNKPAKPKSTNKPEQTSRPDKHAGKSFGNNRNHNWRNDNRKQSNTNTESKSNNNQKLTEKDYKQVWEKIREQQKKDSKYENNKQKEKNNKRSNNDKRNNEKDDKGGR